MTQLLSQGLAVVISKGKQEAESEAGLTVAFKSCASGLGLSTRPYVPDLLQPPKIAPPSGCQVLK